jgi:hypothetical protein
MWCSQLGMLTAARLVTEEIFFLYTLDILL